MRDIEKRIRKSLRWRPISDVAPRALDQFVAAGCTEAEAIGRLSRILTAAGKKPSPAALRTLQDAAELGTHREVAVLLVILSRWSFPEDASLRLFLGTWASSCDDAVGQVLRDLARPVIEGLPGSEARTALLGRLSR